jgi:hypothetical protein
MRCAHNHPTFSVFCALFTFFYLPHCFSAFDGMACA